MDPPPGCLVLLLRLSAGMTADVVTGRGESVAFAAARQLADELLDGLVNTALGGYAVGAIDVAVLGYRTAEDGSPQLLSLLPDGDTKPRFVPLAQVAEMPAVPRDAEGQPKKWAVLPPCAGDPCPTAALASVYQMVSVWLTGRFAARPPVVIHCTGADALDEAYHRVARSLGLLATAHGPARLLTYVFAEPTPQPPPCREGEQELDAPSSVSEVLRSCPPSLQGGGWGVGSPGRVFVNDWDITDPWDALFTYAWHEDTTAWVGSGGFDRDRAMWAQKMGNTPEQWEDAYALDTPNGAAVVADGASSGIYCSIWAQQLSQRFLTDRPDTRDPVSLNKWVNGLRTEWRTAINYSNLNWSKQAKVDQVGAAATILTLETGPAGAGGERPWRACAVGDASLFWVRDGRLLATFPVVAADQFGSAPFLVRSNPGFRTLTVAAAGTCRPGDRFVLATDAVAARLFKSAAAGPGPEWGRFETITEDDWRAELDTLRRANDMVNDDCTLVVLRVSGGDDPWRAGGVSPLVEQDAEESQDEQQERAEDQHSADRHSHDDQQGDDHQGADAPRSPEELPPADDPPAARDGFPEPTDPRV